MSHPQIRKVVYLLTSNDFKYMEFVDIFKSYNLQVKKVCPQDNIENQVKHILKNNNDCKVVIREEVCMRDYYSGKIVDKYEDCLRVVVYSDMNIWTLGSEKKYSNKIEGYIDLSKKKSSQNVFGWDDIFVVKYTNMSYYEKKQKGYKVSPRDNNISDYIRDYIYYKQRRKFKFTQTKDHVRTIDFNNTGCVDFLENNIELLDNFYSRKLGLYNLFVEVCNNGAFLRSVQNRRENIYWCPGLNAGIPHIQKKDKIHELTFTVHDFFHFLVPDLVFTGIDTPLHKKVYVITRMLSEAITIVLADMIFVDTLRMSGVEYDWSKRRIWPLFNSISEGMLYSLDTVERNKFLKTLIKANVSYCLLGRDTEYKRLTSNHTHFNNFVEKYSPFFVEDYKWTNSNWCDMCGDGVHFGHWWEKVSGLRGYFGFGRLESVGEYIDRLGLDGFCGDMEELVFRILDDLLGGVLDKLDDPQTYDTELQISNRAFGRWIIGQNLIFSKFYFIPESKFYQDKIIDSIKSRVGLLSFRDMDNIRGLYEQYLDILLEKSLISKDDKITYSEIYPIFRPSFANYDKGFDNYKSISDVVIDLGI